MIRRNGSVVAFESHKIAVALMKAFLAVLGTTGAASASVREQVDVLTQQVVRSLMRSRPCGGTFHIEDIQDQVELSLMRGGHHEVARAYVLYREHRNQERARMASSAHPDTPRLYINQDGQRVALDVAHLLARIEAACSGMSADVQAQAILQQTLPNLYDGVSIDDVYKATILAARSSAGSASAWGRKWKMPPPPLSITSRRSLSA